MGMQNMEISPFTTDHMDEVFTRLKKDYVQELLSRATVEGDMVLDIPGYRQVKSFTCGFVSGFMVLEYFGIKTSSEKFYKLCRPHQEWGISTRKLSDALRKMKIKVVIRQKLSFDEIADAISEGKPIITSVKRRNDIQHWIVIYGVNRRTKEIFVAGDKFWFTPDATRYKWDPYRKKIATWADFLICQVH
jgi:hypothetical protein